MHQAHSPQGPPTRYTARTRNQRPSQAWAITPALPTQPGHKGGRRQGRERHEDTWNRNQIKPDAVLCSPCFDAVFPVHSILSRNGIVRLFGASAPAFVCRPSKFDNYVFSGVSGSFKLHSAFYQRLLL